MVVFRTLAAAVLAIVLAIFELQTPRAGTARSTQPQSISDPIEAAAYRDASAVPDPYLRGEALIAFLRKYPHSIVQKQAHLRIAIAFKYPAQRNRLDTLHAVTTVRDHNPAALSITDWETILSYRDLSPANKTAAGKVWSAIQSAQGHDRPMVLRVLVLSSSPLTIDAALASLNIEARTADIHVVMASPVAHPPTSGTAVHITGFLTNYKPSPFLFTMTKAHILASSRGV